MTELTSRNKNQILFNLLPEQTVDIKSRIWRVVEWTSPERVDVDEQRIRNQLIREIQGWSTTGRDSGFAGALSRNHPLEIRGLNLEQGVRVEPFPRWYQCRKCDTIGFNEGRSCANCHQKLWAQLHYVGYHECGFLTDPFVNPCPTHGLMKIVTPGTARAAEIEFHCPSRGCTWRNSRKGLGVRLCPACKKGPVFYTVHRASSVYTPQSITVINPPSAEALAEVSNSGGRRKALLWVLDEIPEADSFNNPKSLQEIEEGLASLPETYRKIMLESLRASGELPEESTVDLSGIPDDLIDQAESEAVEVRLAVRGGRLSSEELARRSAPLSVQEKFAVDYPAAIQAAGLSGIDLVDQFPILRGMYGYTRGDASKATLQPFRTRTGAFRVHADVGMTEAILVRLDPTRVADWLRSDFPDLPEVNDAQAARLMLLAHNRTPGRLEDVATPTVGSRVAELVHSYAHRLIRQTAVFAGIDRESLGEHLLPAHCAFFLYAQPRGEFVLGGLQAVFEEELHQLLRAFVESDHRCPLDPGCGHANGACPACLHLGEPSCRWLNRHLSRFRLHGESGFLPSE
ncbi:DUF1998 domain-containing protein [Streptomyces sp. NPDC052302]|uniref:DUF1998 domain-containing protein n=1 Tax=Streptomyces sp. NPDC052302 TaxID=3365688 RepID=UPI0037D0C926